MYEHLDKETQRDAEIVLRKINHWVEVLNKLTGTTHQFVGPQEPETPAKQKAAGKKGE